MTNGCATSWTSTHGALPARNVAHHRLAMGGAARHDDRIGPADARARSTSPAATPTVTRSATRRIVATARSSSVRPPSVSHALGPRPSRSPRPAASTIPSTAASLIAPTTAEPRRAARPRPARARGAAGARRRRTRAGGSPDAGRSRVRTSCQRHVAGSGGAAVCSPRATRRARVENVLGGALGVAPVREAAEQGLRIVPPALAARAGVVERRRHGRRQLADVPDLVAEVAPSPHDVVAEPGGIRAMSRVGDEDDRPVESEELEDHARCVRQEDVARERGTARRRRACLRPGARRDGPRRAAPSAPSTAGASRR